MGNYGPGSIGFLQSPGDFPLLVTLDGKNPAWALKRWSTGGLAFLPPDDEGFTLRGDKRRLLYKGRRKSHRFTILGSHAFEYDVVLEKEPENSIIALKLEGAEGFDFLRQPDTLENPFLAGSYAVYKKETLIGEGTGKLCHIHRPRIIDARGRTCWGDLAVIGNELRIMVPDLFLSEAAYPVIVDPTIGTSTVGSQIKIANTGNDYFDYPWLENSIGLNTFTVTQGGAGTCTAFIYAHYNSITGNESSYDITPCLYTNKNGEPYARLSHDEMNTDVFVGVRKVDGVNTTFSPGWRQSTFSLAGSLEAGTVIWFGGYSQFFTTRFDYGLDFYRIWPDIDLYPEAEDMIPPPFLEPGPWDEKDNYRFSWYFAYTGVQSFVRTITQGVTLNCSAHGAGFYKRHAQESIRGISALSGGLTFLRRIASIAVTASFLKRSIIFARTIAGQIPVLLNIKKSGTITRKLAESAKTKGDLFRGRGFFRWIYNASGAGDFLSVPLLFTRSMKEMIKPSLTSGHWAAFVRGFQNEAGISTENSRTVLFIRRAAEGVQVYALNIRRLIIFLRIFTFFNVRDFVLRHFLKSNEELAIKSIVCTQITLDSPLH